MDLVQHGHRHPLRFLCSWDYSAVGVAELPWDRTIRWTLDWNMDVCWGTVIGFDVAMVNWRTEIVGLAVAVKQELASKRFAKT